MGLGATDVVVHDRGCPVDRPMGLRAGGLRVSAAGKSNEVSRTDIPSWPGPISVAPGKIPSLSPSAPSSLMNDLIANSAAE